MPLKPLWENDEDVLVDEDLDLDLDTDLPAQIIVYNDDHNTFEWVIESCIDILGHTSVQAEQLALIIHTKGKATVKTGPKAELLPLMQGLNDRGLSAVIEEG
jgi:ATP-dependent Clp protease adaptor protein ClpS